MTLHTTATLVDMHISMWSARRHDPTASNEIAKAHNAGDAGRFNKMLIDKEPLAPIVKAAGALRVTHYNLTLPWYDTGARLLPNELFLRYQDEMAGPAEQFRAAVKQFVRDYPELVKAARKRLGTLYRVEDYPVEIAERFNVHFEFAPIADVQDFRVSASQEAEALIRQRVTDSVTESLQQRQKAAMREVYERVKASAERVRAICTAVKPIVRDSLMEEAETLHGLIDPMNLMGDPQMAALKPLLRAMIFPTVTLRSSLSARKSAAAAADTLIATLEPLLA